VFTTCINARGSVDSCNQNHGHVLSVFSGLIGHSVVRRVLWEELQRQYSWKFYVHKESPYVNDHDYNVKEDGLLCLHSGIYILSWTDIQAKGPKGQRAKGPVCRTRSVDSRGGPLVKGSPLIL
jgi:hypothetical protein